MKLMSDVHTGGGDTAQNSKTEAGTPHKRIEQMQNPGWDTAH